MTDSDHLCKGCQMNLVFPDQEIFAMTKNVQAIVGAETQLCILCVESRLGRVLVPIDFEDSPVNWFDGSQRSDLLRDRLGMMPQEVEDSLYKEFMMKHLQEHRRKLGDYGGPHDVNRWISFPYRTEGHPRLEFVKSDEDDLPT